MYSGARSQRETALATEVMPKQQWQTLLLLSAAQSLVDLVSEVSGPQWKVEHLLIVRGNPFTLPNLRLVLLDDGVVEENERGWLLGQIRKHAPDASLLYVAASHTEENERRARSNGALYYVSKPLQPSQFILVLQAFLNAHQAK